MITFQPQIMNGKKVICLIFLLQPAISETTVTACFIRVNHLMINNAFKFMYIDQCFNCHRRYSTEYSKEYKNTVCSDRIIDVHLSIKKIGQIQG